ncbi:MAG: hypothetical protein KatS3mg015_0414 [Fimbriimonadales bacterium]|nr:MAG: hypothetical protein KatS3mg015_0414 [Fimbriimonadales bacterium]
MTIEPIPEDWREIEAVLRGERQEYTSQIPPLDPLPPAPECPKCKEPMEWIRYATDSESWRNLRGRGGYLAVCVPCQVWTPLRVMVMG